MTDSEINKTIAEYIQWKPAIIPRDMTGKPFEGWDIPPDYCNNLNEMHEAEKFLEGGHNWNKYTDILGKLCHYKSNIHDLRSFANIIVSASAKQRAEAFLKTIGKWKE